MERRTARSRGSPTARAVAALLVSLAVNGAALALLGAAGALAPGAPRPVVSVALAPRSRAAWEAHRRVGEAAPPGAAARPHPAAPAPPREAASSAEGRLVRVAPAPDARRPDQARFLAERDGRVERETRWRGPPPAEPVVALAPRPLPGAPGAGGPSVGEEGRAEVSAPGGPGDAGPEAAAGVEAARRALAPEAPGDPAPRPALLAAGGGEGGGVLAGRFDPRVLPFADGPAAPGGGAPSGEALPGVADGEATLVNTRAFRFAGFYRRVHDAIAGEWRPNRAWDARDPHDRLLGRTRRQVQVDILLEADGRLRELRLVRGSGLAFFDAECLRAVREAAPFPNPPRGLADAEGIIALRGWRLVFEFGPEELLDRWLPGR